MPDTPIRGGLIIDGTGAPAFRADIGIREAVMGPESRPATVQEPPHSNQGSAPEQLRCRPGAPITMFAMKQPEKTGGRYGSISSCCGGGQGSTAIIENLSR